jgi:hypothetical protein
MIENKTEGRGNMNEVKAKIEKVRGQRKDKRKKE